MEKRKIYFVTGSRADYGIVRNYLKFLNEDESIDLCILVTGALLSPKYGHQVELIYEDKFHIDAEIEIPIDPSGNKGIIHSMAVALDKFGEYFSLNQPQLLIILGDRYEMLPVATAASMNRIPILHIHGGEATFGNYDEFIRHAITKMSLFHFAATEEYRKRIIQLGENPSYVFNLGALGAENCLNIDESMVTKEIKELAAYPYFVVLFHPETMTNEKTSNQINELLLAIKEHLSYKYVFLGTNADTYSDLIRDRVIEFVDSNNNCIFIENLPTNQYHYLVANSMGLIGNSSSGLIEAPSLNTFTINVGGRQAGRVRGNSVIDVPCSHKEIEKAIKKVVEYNREKRTIDNPYFKPNTAINYYIYTLGLLNELENNLDIIPKKFFDL